MALLTTTPASEITPTPVMMMPKGVLRDHQARRSTPISERITLDRITSGTVTEPNWLTSTTKMSMIATAEGVAQEGLRLLLVLALAGVVQRVAGRQREIRQRLPAPAASRALPL